MQITVALLWEQHYGLTEEHIGYMFAFIGFASAIVQGGLIGWLTRTFGEERLMVVGCILLGLGLLMIPFVPPAYFMPLALFLSFLYWQMVV